MPIFRPIWPPSGSKNCSAWKINPNFLGFFHTFLRKRARRGQLRRVISRQPCKVEKKVSPFWKLDKQGFNIRLKPRKSKIWPWTPPLSPQFRRHRNLKAFRIPLLFSAHSNSDARLLCRYDYHLTNWSLELQSWPIPTKIISWTRYPINIIPKTEN